MARLRIALAIPIGIAIYGCGFIFGDSYEEDFENDREVLKVIIESNPVLDSIPESHRFFETDAEYSRLTGLLNLGNLGLNDSNFNFPKRIQDFRIIKFVSFSGNDFTELPRGTRHKNWSSVLVIGNRICKPSSETVLYLDEKTKGSLGGYWRDTQRCNDSIPVVPP